MILISHDLLRASRIQNKDLESLWGINSSQLYTWGILIDDLPFRIKTEDILIRPIFKRRITPIDRFTAFIGCCIR